MLKESQIKNFLENSLKGNYSLEQQLKFLQNFVIEKVTAKHLKIFAEFLIKNMTAKLEMPEAMDICGTGGSGLLRINTSTVAAFLLADLGLKIAKHGNKAAGGRCGSFDLLETLGVEIEKSPKELEKSYKEKGLAFIYARSFHPTMKFFAEARKALAKPTIFNILGPLLNPANPKIQIIGTAFKEQMRLIAEAAKLLGKKKVMVVRGFDGLDEVTISGKTEIVELKDGKIFHYTIAPEDFGVRKAKFNEIKGGSLEKNKKIAFEILHGNCKSRHADLVFANCALALKLAGKVADLKEGFKLARSALGIVKLENYKNNFLAEIAASKIIRKSERDFLKIFNEKHPALIAEIKYTSPSNGVLYKAKNYLKETAKLAEIYEKNGARAISVVTDKKYFNGDFEYLRQARQATKKAPILCKDFIVSEYQIFKAREFGADAVLLIAALLKIAQIEKFLKVARSLCMEAIVEIHDEKDLKKAFKTSTKIIGINHRNLFNFKIDLKNSERLIKKIPKKIFVIAESGIAGAEDIKKLDKRIRAVLVGTALIRSKNISKKIYEFTKALSDK